MFEREGCWKSFEKVVWNYRMDNHRRRGEIIGGPNNLEKQYGSSD